jgi:hypothetical protein
MLVVTLTANQLPSEGREEDLDCDYDYDSDSD